MTLRRFSSRTERLDTEFLAKSLQGAVKYFRIAGYFRSSIFELVGEEIAQIPEVKIVCNSELDLVDFLVATGKQPVLFAQGIRPIHIFHELCLPICDKGHY